MQEVVASAVARICRNNPAMTQARPAKIPESVLVIIYTPQLDVLLIERADHQGFWQSVTGSKDVMDEPLTETALREVREETGIDATSAQLRNWHLSNVYDIDPAWRHRYAPGVTRNTEHVFGLCLPRPCGVTLSPHEHRSESTRLNSSHSS